MRLTVFLVLFVLLVQFASGRSVMEAFLFAVALAVGLTPELLPMIMTVTLSRGALRMAAKRVVVKRLAAIHDLGAMDVLCTDKTGTLTEAHIALVGHPGPDGQDSERVLTLAGVNSCLESGIRSPLDQAIIQHCADDKKFQAGRKLDEVPFDFERRCVSVLAETEGQRILIIKGAPEPVLAKASALDTGDGVARPLDGDGARRARSIAAGAGVAGKSRARGRLEGDAEGLHRDPRRGRARSGHRRLLRLRRSAQGERGGRRSRGSRQPACA